MAYIKLFETILDSTIWQETDTTRILWITMLAAANKHGEVLASLPGLAKRAAISIPATEAGLAKFLGPDKYSRTKDDEGRRIAEIDGGWMLLNYEKYRKMASLDERREADAERSRRFRARRKSNASVTLRHDFPIQAEAEAEADADAEEDSPSSRGSTDTVERAVAIFNDRAGQGNDWPKVTAITAKRRSLLKRLLAETSTGGLEGWQAMLDKAQASDFVSGRIQRSNGHENWKASLAWLARPDVFAAVIEGQYDNGQANGAGASAGKTKHASSMAAGLAALAKIRAERSSEPEW